MTAQELRIWLVSKIVGLTGIDPQLIGVWEPFTAFGLASRDVVILSGELEELLGHQLSPTLLYDYPSIGVLAQRLAAPPEGADPDSHLSPGLTPEADILGNILAEVGRLSEAEAETLIEKLSLTQEPRGEEPG